VMLNNRRNHHTMCMNCKHDYSQQISTARDTLEYCSAECELENKFPIMCHMASTAAKLLVTLSLKRTA
jgi:hypothetical protein